MKTHVTGRSKTIFMKYWALMLTQLLMGLALVTFATGCTARASQGTGIYPAPVLGVVVDQNLRVVDVEAGSAADQAGIRRGDVIKMLENVPVAAPDEAARVIRQARVGQKLAISVGRDNMEITLEAHLARPVARPGQPTPTPVPADEYYF